MRDRKTEDHVSLMIAHHKEKECVLGHLIQVDQLMYVSLPFLLDVVINTTASFTLPKRTTTRHHRETTKACCSHNSTVEFDAFS